MMTVEKPSKLEDKSVEIDSEEDDEVSSKQLSIRISSLCSMINLCSKSFCIGSREITKKGEEVR